jgi:O-methyltransferase
LDANAPTWCRCLGIVLSEAASDAGSNDAVLCFALLYPILQSRPLRRLDIGRHSCCRSLANRHLPSLTVPRDGIYAGKEPAWDGGMAEYTGGEEMDPAGLYLELLKRCLLDLIRFDDPLASMVPAGVAHRRRPVRAGLRMANRLLNRMGLMLVEPMRTPLASLAGVSNEQLRDWREEGIDWPVRGHTMVGRKRLDHLQQCIETVLRERIPGDLMETGVWRGGCVILMRAALAAFSDTDRCVWVADSFRGLPPPDTKWSVDAGAEFHLLNDLAVPRADVEGNFQRYGLLDERVRFLEGWFEETMPIAPVEQLALLRLDGDMYGSTMTVLETMYDRVSPGGFIIIDDFALGGCQRAVVDFRAARGIDAPVETIDWTGAFWRKQSAEASCTLATKACATA